MNEIIKKNGITYGIIIGLISVLVTTILYSIDLDLFINPAIGVISILIHISIGVLLVIKTKKQLNNIISFKEVFTVYFLAGILGNMISTLFNIVLFNFVDPQAKETLKELTIKYAVKMMEKFGTPKAALNEAIQKLNETDSFSIGQMIQGMVTSFVIIALFGLILGAIFKSKPSQGL